MVIVTTTSFWRTVDMFREDYLSSGEYFLIRLYRTIMSSARLIVIDEIDISLDAVA